MPPRKSTDELAHIWEAIDALPDQTWLVVEMPDAQQAARLRHQTGMRGLVMRHIGGSRTVYLANRLRVQDVAHFTNTARPPENEFRIVGTVETPPHTDLISPFYASVIEGVGKLTNGEWLEIRFDTMKQLSQAHSYILGHGQTRHGLTCRMRSKTLTLYVQRKETR